MALITFTRNHDDLSSDTGFQFKFYCDKCGNGHMSEFVTSKVGAAGSLLRTAGALFGGVLGNMSSQAGGVQRIAGSKEHDAAFRAAVDEARTYFKQCSRCGKWVCPENCWNPDRSLCEECAPDLREEAAAAQAGAAKNQIWEKAAATDQTEGADMKRKAVAFCPQCGEKSSGGKFCASCGGQLASSTQCSQCGAAFKPGSKFCPECGQKAG